jgi:hypothetical protein
MLKAALAMSGKKLETAQMPIKNRNEEVRYDVAHL